MPSRRSIHIIFRQFVLACCLFAASPGVFAQPQIKSQEVSEADGIPVLIKHLPDWENVRNNTVFIQNSSELRNAIENRPVLELIEFTAGTEAVTAPYPTGNLLIIEYTNPQSSLDADGRIIRHLTETPQNPPVIYRRIGNYNAFVFDAADQAAANVLLDQIKYQKIVQWLGEDPYLLQRLERYFVTTTRDIFISTVIWIVGGIGLSIVTGIIAGFFFFRFRENKRATRTAYSDAGGLTRLNLDELSE
ncbi:hypothetical protein BH18ACI3_BH18ACI3_08810 [soil metagenome]